MALKNNGDDAPLERFCLDQLAPGVAAAITQLDADDTLTARLRAMGLCEGRSVRVVRRGSPLIVDSMGVRMGVAPALAKRVHIAVQPEEAAESAAPTDQAHA